MQHDIHACIGYIYTIICIESNHWIIHMQVMPPVLPMVLPGTDATSQNDTLTIKKVTTIILRQPPLTQGFTYRVMIAFWQGHHHLKSKSLREGFQLRKKDLLYLALLLYPNFTAQLLKHLQMKRLPAMKSTEQDQYEVASLLFQKAYPTSDDYQHVAQETLKKYPRLCNGMR